MRILFKDENYVAENVAILGDLVKDDCSDQVSQATIVKCRIVICTLYM